MIYDASGRAVRRAAGYLRSMRTDEPARLHLTDAQGFLVEIHGDYELYEDRAARANRPASATSCDSGQGASPSTPRVPLARTCTGSER